MYQHGLLYPLLLRLPRKAIPYRLLTSLILFSHLVWQTQHVGFLFRLFPNFLCLFYRLRSRFLALLVWFPFLFFTSCFTGLRFLPYWSKRFYLFRFLFFFRCCWGFLLLLLFLFFASVFYTPWPEKRGGPLIYSVRFGRRIHNTRMDLLCMHA